MSKEYSPQQGFDIKVKGTTKNSYDKMYNDSSYVDNQPLDRNTFYINVTPKTIKEMFPYDVNLNYCGTTGYIDANKMTEINLVNNGFAKINLSESEKSTLGNIKYVEGNIKNEFLIKISSDNKYFNLYVPVVDEIN